MRLYYELEPWDREAILRDGFRDDKDGGVLLIDRGLDEDESVERDDVIIVDIHPELIEPYELVSDRGPGYREFLVPAAILNTHATSLEAPHMIVHFKVEGGPETS